MKTTLQYNPWGLPGPPVYLEGKPSPIEMAREIAEAEAAKKVWTPGPDAWALVDELKAFIGREVAIQGWDPIMLLLDDEGPSPIRATCVDVVTREEEGLVRAYLVLNSPRSISTGDEKEVLWQLVQDGDLWLFGLDKLYEIKVSSS